MTAQPCLAKVCGDGHGDLSDVDNDVLRRFRA